MRGKLGLLAAVGRRSEPVGRTVMPVIAVDGHVVGSGGRGRMLLLLMRGREEEEEEKEVEKEEEEEELSFLLSRKLRRVSMSKSILLSDGFTVAVLRRQISDKYSESDKY